MITNGLVFPNALNITIVETPTGVCQCGLEWIAGWQWVGPAR